MAEPDNRSSTSAVFDTSPKWFRPILRAERAVLDRAYRSRRQQALDRVSAGRPSDEPADRQVTLLGTSAGERLVPGKVRGEVFAHHLARYVWALPRLDGERVIELGSGPGYGSELLSWAASSVTGIDLDERAVSDARSRYTRDNLEFLCRDVTRDLSDIGSAGVVVCFEVIEHVSDPRGLLRGAFALAPRLLLSMPNPLAGGSHINPFHRNDWPPSTLWRALHEAGARRVRWYRQGVVSSTVRRGASPVSGVWLVDARR